MRQLGPNPFIYSIQPAHMQFGTELPGHLRFGMICMTLSHRINRLRSSSEFDGNAVAFKREAPLLLESFYRYRGLVIRSLSEDLGNEAKRGGNVVIAGIVMLLLAEVSSVAAHHHFLLQEGLLGRDVLNLNADANSYPAPFRFNKAPRPTGGATSRVSTA